MTVETARPIRPAVLLAAALAIVALAYRNAIDAPFVWDDHPLIVDEPGVHEINPRSYFLSAFWRASPSEQANPIYYRPLVTLTYAIEWKIGGGDPALFHAINVALHLIVTALVYLLARRCGARPLAAALGAALFGTMPRLTESVSWISGRTDVLAALFGISAIIVHTRTGAGNRDRAAAATLLLAGLLSKEAAIAAFCGILAFEIAAREETIRARAVRLLPAVTSVAAYFVLRWNALAAIPPQDTVYPPGLHRVALVPQALGEYVLMLLDPLRPRLQIGILGQFDATRVALGLLATVLAGTLLWRTRRAPAPAAWAVIATGSVALGLVVHIVPLSLDVVAADRFLYIPVAALAVLGAAAASAATGWRARAITAAAGTTLLAFTAAAHVRALDWTNEVRLWKVAVETTPPENPLPPHEFGNALTRAGRQEDALEQYRRAAAVARDRRKVTAYANAATTLADLERPNEAAEVLLRLRRIARPQPIDHYNLGVVEAKRLRFDAAEAELQQALSLMRDYPQAQRMLEIVRECRREYEALPWPEPASEPTERHLRRGQLFARLGLFRRAQRYLTDVARAPDATADQVLLAAWFFVARAPESAGEAIDRARSLGIPAKVLQPLEEDLATRRERSSP